MSTPTSQQQQQEQGFSIFAAPPPTNSSSDAALVGRSPSSSTTTPRMGGGTTPRNSFSVSNTNNRSSIVVGGGGGGRITPRQSSSSSAYRIMTASPPQAPTPSTLDLTADRFIASVEPGAFHGPESPQVTLAVPSSRSSSERGRVATHRNNNNDPFAIGGGRRGFEDEDERGDPALSGLSGTTREALGADEESRSQYRKALRDTMGVGNSVMRYSPYSSPPQSHPTATPPTTSSPSMSFGGGGGASASGGFGGWTPTSTPVPAMSPPAGAPRSTTPPVGSFGLPSDIFTSFSAGGQLASAGAGGGPLFQSGSSNPNLLMGGPLAIVSGGYHHHESSAGVVHDDFSPQTFAEASPGEDFSPQHGGGGGDGYSTPRKTERVPTAGGGFASLGNDAAGCRTPPSQTTTPAAESSSAYALDTPTRLGRPRSDGGGGGPPLDSTTNSELNRTNTSIQNYFAGEGATILTSSSAAVMGASPSAATRVVGRRFGTPLQPPPGADSSSRGTGGGMGPMSTTPTPAGFMTPVVEEQRVPLASSTPGTSPQLGSSSGGGAFGSSRAGGGGTSPVVGSRFSPAISLTSTPSRQEATYHKRRRRLEGSTPVRILNAEGIIDQVGCSALSWTESALFIALRNTLYAWTKDSVDVAFEIPEPSITCVAAGDVPQTTSSSGSIMSPTLSSAKLPSDASTNAPDDRPATYLALGTENGLVHVIRMVQIGVPLQPNFVEDPETGNLIPADAAATRIQWHFMITEHMTQCTAADITEDKLATGSAEGVLILTDLKTQAPLHRLTLNSSAMSIRFSPRDAAHLAVGIEKGITFFKTSDPVEPITIDTEGPVKCISWNPHTLVSVLTYAVGSTIFSYSPGSGMRGYKEVKAPVTALCWSLRAPELVVGHGTTISNAVFSGAIEGDAVLQNSVSIYDGSDTTELSSESNSMSKLRLCSVISGHRSPPFHLAMEPINGACVVSGAGGVDNTLRFWNLYPENMDDKKHHLTRSPGSGGGGSGADPRVGETVHFSSSPGGGRGTTVADEGGIELFPSARQQRQTRGGGAGSSSPGAGASYFDPFTELR